MGKTYLFAMMGHAGSGKSYFARQLSKHEGMVRLNADTLRTEVYGSVEEMIRYKTIDKTLLSDKIFKALDYLAKQVVGIGLSVVLDTNNNRQSTRENYARLATELRATFVTIWVQTPFEDALVRVQKRDTTPDQHRWDEGKAREVIKRHIANTDEPSEDENVIIIEGTIPFEEQYESFKKQLAEIENE